MSDMGEQQECFVQQVAYADLVLLNKTDMVEASQQDDVVKEIIGINPLINIIKTVKGEVDLSRIFGLRTLAPQAAEKSVDEVEKSESHGHSHLTEIQSVCLRYNRCPLSYEKVTLWIGSLLWETDDTDAAEKIFRIKGVLWIDKEENTDNKPPSKWVLQAVHDTFECWDSGKAFGDSTPSSAIVFIGKSLDEKILKQGIQSCSKGSSS